MRRWMAGACALGLVGGGSLGFFGAAGAQETPEPEFVELDATLSPTEAHAGETITVTSVDPCTQIEGQGAPTTLEWFWFADDEASEEFDFGTVDVAEDGSWEVTFDAPDVAGAYSFGADCLPENFDEIAEQCFPDDVDLQQATIDEEEPGGEEPPTTVTVPPTTETTVTEPGIPCVFQIYGPLDFTVVGDGSPTEPPTSPPTAPPAQPVAGEPTFTG